MSKRVEVPPGIVAGVWSSTRQRRVGRELSRRARTASTAPGGLLVLVLVGSGLGCGSSGPRPSPPPPPLRFSLGLTAPVELLRYRHDDRYPAYCRRAAILERIKSLAETSKCIESTVAIGDVPTRLITCDLPRDLASVASTCPAQYVAQIWQERSPQSAENYLLEMYARVRVQCGRDEEFETFHASDALTKAAEHRSADILELLASCKQ
jgi:hypothetical protein